MKKDVMRAIREKCIDCCAGQLGEVRLCPVTDCSLYPYRFGNDPWPTSARSAQKVLENYLPCDEETEEISQEASYTDYKVSSEKTSLAETKIRQEEGAR